MTNIDFSFDPNWMETLTTPFMTNAFIAGLCIAFAAGVMGYFTIARHSTFAAHALAHIGLPGASIYRQLTGTARTAGFARPRCIRVGRRTGDRRAGQTRIGT